jgi:hypothetical protein
MACNAPSQLKGEDIMTSPLTAAVIIILILTVVVTILKGE